MNVILITLWTFVVAFTAHTHTHQHRPRLYSKFRQIPSAIPCVFMSKPNNLDSNEYSLMLAETLISIHNRHVIVNIYNIVYTANIGKWQCLP